MDRTTVGEMDILTDAQIMKMVQGMGQHGEGSGLAIISL